MSRSYARESVFKLVFEYLFSKEKNTDMFADVLNEDENKQEQNYIQEVYNGVLNKYPDLIQQIEKYSYGFALERIYKVDLAILLVALYEIKFIDSIPNKVSVNEALNLAKIYSTEKSAKFINGVLSNFMEE